MKNFFCLWFLCPILLPLFFLTHIYTFYRSFFFSFYHLHHKVLLSLSNFLSSFNLINRQTPFFLFHVTYNLPFLINKNHGYAYPCRSYRGNKNVVESGQSERSSLSACRSMRNPTVPTWTVCQHFVGGPKPTRLPGSGETLVVQSRHCDECSRHDILYWKPDTTFR